MVVANRDERLGRASSPPFAWPAGFVAPRDDVAGGTWLGVNAHGVFVAITNRHGAYPDPARESRGAIVERALRLPTARAIHESASTIPPARHNGFHLVYADANDVLATFSDGASLAQVTLGDGLHVVTERSFGAGDDRPRVRRIRAAFARANVGPAALESFTGVLADHDEADPLAAPCVHITGVDYGTRSAMVYGVGDRGGSPRMLWAEGPPCRTPFRPVDLSC